MLEEGEGRVAAAAVLSTRKAPASDASNDADGDSTGVTSEAAKAVEAEEGFGVAVMAEKACISAQSAGRNRRKEMIAYRSLGLANV